MQLPRRIHYMLDGFEIILLLQVACLACHRFLIANASCFVVCRQAPQPRLQLANLHSFMGSSSTWCCGCRSMADTAWFSWGSAAVVAASAHVAGGRRARREISGRGRPRRAAETSLAETFELEKERRVASGELNGRILDKLSVAPEQANPSPYYPPDRVVEHVLSSLASLPIDEAIAQAFIFSWFDVANPTNSPAVQRQNWKQETSQSLELSSFSQMVYEDYGFLLDRDRVATKYLASPQWSDDDHRVSFFIALDDSWQPGTPYRAPALTVTLRRGREGSHRDCWLVYNLSLLAAEDVSLLS